MPGPSGVHQIANQDPNYGKFIKSTIWYSLLNILKAQTSILPSFPKTLISRCCVECMKLSYLSQPLHPLSATPLITRWAATYYRVASTALLWFSLLCIISYMAEIYINPFRSNHAITFLFRNELYIVSSSLSLSAVRGSLSWKIVQVWN